MLAFEMVWKNTENHSFECVGFCFTNKKCINIKRNIHLNDD
jgi:hypothetical protein